MMLFTLFFSLVLSADAKEFNRDQRDEMVRDILDLAKTRKISTSSDQTGVLYQTFADSTDPAALSRNFTNLIRWSTGTRTGKWNPRTMAVPAGLDFNQIFLRATERDFNTQFASLADAYYIVHDRIRPIAEARSEQGYDSGRNLYAKAVDLTNDPDWEKLRGNLDHVLETLSATEWAKALSFQDFLALAKDVSKSPDRTRYLAYLERVSSWFAKKRASGRCTDLRQAVNMLPFKSFNEHSNTYFDIFAKALDEWMTLDNVDTHARYLNDQAEGLSDFSNTVRDYVPAACAALAKGGEKAGHALASVWLVSRMTPTAPAPTPVGGATSARP